MILKRHSPSSGRHHRMLIIFEDVLTRDYYY